MKLEVDEEASMLYGPDNGVVQLEGNTLEILVLWQLGKTARSLKVFALVTSSTCSDTMILS